MKILTLISILLLILLHPALASATGKKKIPPLHASWYSIQSLKDEGTYKHSKGVMANGKIFNDNALTCATRLYPLGSVLRITALNSGHSVVVRVTDRIGIRFARTRVDLSKGAFREIANLKQGIISVKVERIK
jgi:rare lipoprotein A